MPSIEFFGLSETGPVREDNQDNMWLPGDSYPDPGALFILADGMGGYARGDIASEVAIRAMFQTVTGSLSQGNINGSAPGVLRKGIEMANTAVINTASRMNIAHLGTTLMAAWILGDRLHLVHVCDSRAYLLRREPDGVYTATCLTIDHSVVGDLLRAKVIKAAQVRNHARRSYLTRAIGINFFVQPDLATIALRPDDCLILCTDGLWAFVEDEQLADIVQSDHSLDQVCRKILDAAYSNGSDDNASVIVVRIRDIVSAPQPESAVQTGEKLKRAWFTRSFFR
jgi:PPM family protein phosphatase